MSRKEFYMELAFSVLSLLPADMGCCNLYHKKLRWRTSDIFPTVDVVPLCAAVERGVHAGLGPLESYLLEDFKSWSLCTVN